jgi:hypothetical protein
MPTHPSSVHIAKHLPSDFHRRVPISVMSLFVCVFGFGVNAQDKTRQILGKDRFFSSLDTSAFTGEDKV